MTDRTTGRTTGRTTDRTIGRMTDRTTGKTTIHLTFMKEQVEIIQKYFPNLTEEQQKQFAALYDLYIDWNAKINVISRKDIENLYEHHVLHSLGIAKMIQFHPGTRVMDLGTAEDSRVFPWRSCFPTHISTW